MNKQQRKAYRAAEKWQYYTATCAPLDKGFLGMPCKVTVDCHQPCTEAEARPMIREYVSQYPTWSLLSIKAIKYAVAPGQAPRRTGHEPTTPMAS